MVSDEGNGLVEQVYIQQFIDMPPYVPDIMNKPRAIVVCADFNSQGDNETSIVAMASGVGAKIVSYRL